MSPGPAPTPADPVSGVTYDAVVAPDEEQVAAFGVLRSPAADSLPGPAQTAINKAPRDELGANPALARQASTDASGKDLFVLPARGWMCLAAADGVVACNRTSEARKGYLLSVTGLADGRQLVRGVVPDGSSAVQVAGRSVQTVLARGNTYSVLAPADARTVRFTDGAGAERSIMIGAPQK